jgi:hypothetical protein
MKHRIHVLCDSCASLLRRTVARSSVCLPYALLILSIGSILILWLQDTPLRELQNFDDLYRPARGFRVSQDLLFQTSLLLLPFLAMWAGFVTHRPGHMQGKNEGEVSEKQQIGRAFVMSLSIGIVALLYPVYQGIVKNGYSSLIYTNSFGFLDKRWLFSLYWVFVLSVLLLPALILRLMDGRIFSSEVSGGATGAPVSEYPPGFCGRPRWTRIALKTALAVAISFAAFGPPWNIDHLGLGLEGHEVVHLGALQAIHEGYLPGIGPASIQYGPGSLFLSNKYMTLTGSYNIAGFRETFAIFNFVGFSIFSLILFLSMNTWIALIVVVFSLILPTSPFHFYQWADGGILSGFFGWANSLRYMGVILLIFLLPYCYRSVGRVACLMRSCILGFVWGTTTSLAQENLGVGIMALVVFLILIYATRSCSAKHVLYLILGLGTGLLLFWLPVMGYYLKQGHLQQFLEFYFLIPRHVSNGYSNAPYYIAWNMIPGIGVFLREWSAVPGLTYHLVPFVGVGVGLVALYDWRKIRLQTPLTPERMLVLQVVCITLTCFTGSLFRSEPIHLINTLCMWPCLIVLSIVFVPRFLAVRPVSVWFFRTCVILFFLFVNFPTLNLAYDIGEGFFQKRIKNRLAAFRIDSSAREANQSDRVTGSLPLQRMGRGIRESDSVFRSFSIPVETFENDMLAIKALIGKRKTYVEYYPLGWNSSLPYFFADLEIAPFLADPYTMIIHQGLQEKFDQHFESILPLVGAIITKDTNSRLAQKFLSYHKNAVVLQRRTLGESYTVLLDSPDQAP